ncbi:MAG TPA: AMP-binding protein [Syntrophomonadaceae bacterium]|nr:AMP-binding protein [Syntrophomonadaceae bacterium]
MTETAQAQGRIDFILSLREPRNVSLGSQLEKFAQERPQHPAILYENRVISYSEFNALANRYANYFAEVGLIKGDVVALMMTNRPEYLIATAGLSKLGVIISLINPELRGDVLAHGINLSEARALIIGHELLDLFLTIREEVRLKSPARIFVEGPGPDLNLPANMHHLNMLLNQVVGENPTSTGEVSCKDILLYMFTSGTRGWRKAVPVLHQRWLTMGQQYALYGGMNEDSVQYMCLPLYLQAGFNVCFSGMLATGCTMLLKPDFSVHEFWSEVRRHRTDVFMGVGEMCRYLHDLEPQADDREHPLKVVITNGMLPDLAEPFRQRFGLQHVIEVYGTTENVGSFINQDEFPSMFGSLTINSVRQGEVARYDEQAGVFLRDQNGYLIKCQPGETGVLLGQINDFNPFLGYVNDPDATESVEIHSAFQEGDLYLDTRDLVRLHYNEHLSFLYRLGDSYRWKGKTVSSSAVEDVILRFFSGIDDVAVFGVEVPAYEGRCGMAVLKQIDDEEIDLKGLAGHINRRMPPHARPVFLRIIKTLENGQDLQQLKKQLEDEEFNRSKISDPMYYYDLEASAYLPLTAEKYWAIMNRNIKI